MPCMKAPPTVIVGLILRVHTGVVEAELNPSNVLESVRDADAMRKRPSFVSATLVARPVSGSRVKSKLKKGTGLELLKSKILILLAQEKI